MKSVTLLISALIMWLLSGCVRSVSPGGIPTQPIPTTTFATTTTPLPSSTVTNEAPQPEMTFQPTVTTFTIASPTIIQFTPTITSTPGPPITFFIQEGTPATMANFLMPELGCNWMGVAGQVFDGSGQPLAGMEVRVDGVLEGKAISTVSVTASVAALGTAGYVVQLSDHPIASDGSLWLQVFDSTGNPKTGKVLLTTPDGCERNLILINFVEGVPLISELKLPLMLNMPSAPP